VPVDCGSQVLISKLLDQVKRTSQAANLVNQANGVFNRSRVAANDTAIFRLNLSHPPNCALHLLASDRQSEPGLVGALGCSGKTQVEQ